MSPLPSDILDLVVDQLHDEHATLRVCCLVSKSWIWRTRRYLFARVRFHPAYWPIESWMRAYPDPASSPAHHTRVLEIQRLELISPDAYAWIRSFCHVEKLTVIASGRGDPEGVSLVRLCRLSPTLKTLFLITNIPTPEILNLTCSFPLLEDLTLHSQSSRRNTSEWIIPSTQPKFTGSLRLSGENRSVVHALLDLPRGLHFSKIWVGGSLIEDVDPGMMTELVSKCSDTLESFSICDNHLLKTTTPPPVDLSVATKLRELEFQWGRPNMRWIVTTLQTARPETLRQITIDLHSISIIPKKLIQEWHELDGLLVRLWILHSVVPKFSYLGELGALVASSLPELTKAGFICALRS